VDAIAKPADDGAGRKAIDGVGAGFSRWAPVSAGGPGDDLKGDLYMILYRWMYAEMTGPSLPRRSAVKPRANGTLGA